MNPITLTKKFRARLVEEYSSTPRVTDLGDHDCEMTLYAHHPHPRRDCIVWNYERDGEGDELVIGLGLEGSKVVDYDGVFSLPTEAVALLKEAGLDTTEVE
jgi:hypothetical protein